MMLRSPVAEDYDGSIIALTYPHMIRHEYHQNYNFQRFYWTLIVSKQTHDEP